MVCWKFSLVDSGGIICTLVKILQTLSPNLEHFFEAGCRHRKAAIKRRLLGFPRKLSVFAWSVVVSSNVTKERVKLSATLFVFRFRAYLPIILVCCTDLNMSQSLQVRS